MKKDEVSMFRIIAQKDGITITAETHGDITFEEAKKTAVAEVLNGTDKAVNYQPFVVLPITTKERWDSHFINFCPRCGANLREHELESSEFFDCFECDSSIEVHIHHNNWE